MQQNCKYALVMPWSMHISNVAAQSHWLVRSSWKMTPFTIHYCMAIWSFVLLPICPLPTSLTSIPSISTVIIFITSINWIVWRKWHGFIPARTHPVAISRKPYDADISHSSPDCHTYLLCYGDFELVYLSPVRRSLTRRRGNQSRWNIFTLPSVNQGGKINYRAGGGDGEGGGKGTIWLMVPQ